MLDPVNAIDDLAAVDQDGEDEDLRAVLDAEPCYPKRSGPKPKYKPGTRQEPALREAVDGEGSWWTKPGANFAVEAQRMRDRPTRLKVPGEHNIIGWNAAF